MRSRQANRAVVLAFLNVVPHKLLGEPSSLPGGQSRILTLSRVANGEPFAALFTQHSRHDDRVRSALFVLAQAFSRAI